MILRFVSGSDTPANRPRKRSAALTRIRFISNCSLKTVSTWSPSSLRSRPWSTKTQVSCLPTALCTNTAATEESTPPDNAQRTFLSPTASLISAILRCAKLLIVQSPLTPQTSNRKLEIILRPNGVCSTSGWNCTPYNLRKSLAIPATGHSLVSAVTTNPSGTSDT